MPAASPADPTPEQAFEAAVKKLNAPPPADDKPAEDDDDKTPTPAQQDEADKAAEKPADETPDLAEDGAEEKPAAAEGDKPAETDERKALRKLGSSLAKREAALNAREQTIKASEQAAGNWNKVAQAYQQGGPLAAIAALGLDDQVVLDAYLARAGHKPTEPTAEERIAAIEKRAQEAEQREKQADEAARVTAWKTDAIAKIQADPECDLVNQYGASAHERVINTMVEYWRATGKMPSVIKTARFVESKLEAELKERLSKSKKFAISDRRTVNNNAAASAKKPAANSKATPPSDTLTDNLSDSVSLDGGLPSDPDARWRAIVARNNA